MRAALMFLPLMGMLASALAADIRSEFRAPGKSYRPMIRWWWPGGDVEDGELRREIRLMDEAGFGGAEIQPFRISLRRDASARVDEYLTPSYWAHVRAALEEAKARGMWIDLTFGSGWPFGGGENITPELASMELRFTHRSLRGPSKFAGKLELPPLRYKPSITPIHEMMGYRPVPPDWEERLRKRQKLVAVVAVRGSAAEMQSAGQARRSGLLDLATAQVLTDRVTPDGTLAWDVPEGEWQLFVFAQSAPDMRVLGGVGPGPQLVLDHMRREALESHIRGVGEGARQHVGAYFGNTLRAIFCDSLEVRAFLYWTDSFLADFRRLRGYDLTPYLPILKQPGRGEPYKATPGPPFYDAPGKAERVRRDYWQTVSDVMIANFYQPLVDWAAKNRLLARVQGHGAPADVLKIYGLASIPETEDLYAGGTDDFLKCAASAANLYGRRIVASESFAQPGDPFATTPESIQHGADRFFTAGVNQIVHHGFPYEYMDRPEPGWHPFSSPLPFSTHLNHHNPIWPRLKPLNDYITRIQYVSQAGSTVVPVAVYRDELAYENLPKPADELQTWLTASGYYFDHINADALVRSDVRGRRLVSSGGASYAALMIRDKAGAPPEVAEKLARFARAGLPVLDDGALGELGGKVQPNLRYLTPSQDIFFIEKRIGALDVFFLRNGSTEPRTVDVVFPSRHSPESWDAWTGRIVPERAFEKHADGVRMHLAFEPHDSRLIVFDESEAGGAQEVLPSIAIAPDRWTFELRGGLSDTRTGKRALHVAVERSGDDPAMFAEVAHEARSVRGGDALSASVWNKGSSTRVRLLIRFAGADGRTISTAATKPAAASTRWEKLALKARVPDGCERAILAFEVRGDGHVWFDDASFTAPGGRQLLSNAGFEEGIAGWEPARDGIGAAWVNDSTFVPWGFNYDRTIHQAKDLILEEVPIDKIDRDFRAARKLGANAIRLFLQVSRFMPRYMEMDPAMLSHLDTVIERARKYDLKADITGLSHIAGAPDWYQGHSSEELQRADQHFWETLAKRYAGEPGILDFNLQNEPVIFKPEQDVKPVGCFTMSEKRNFCYVNPHRQMPALSRQETARQWTKAMVAAIHKHDPRRLVTMGMLSSASPVIGSSNPGFDLPTVGPLVDYISIHFYPNRPADDVLRDNQDRLEMILRYAGGFGKPVVMEEWFPMYPPGTKLPEGAWFSRVMEASRNNATGWFTFCFEVLTDGRSDRPIVMEHLRQFRDHATRARSSVPKRPAGTMTVKIDPDLLWRSKDEVARLLTEYQRLRRSGAQVDFMAAASGEQRP